MQTAVSLTLASLIWISFLYYLGTILLLSFRCSFLLDARSRGSVFAWLRDPRVLPRESEMVHRAGPKMGHLHELGVGNLHFRLTT